MSASREAWQRLGEMLEGRRVELDTRYRNLRRFSEERGIDYRLAWDIEHGARENYRRPTLTAIEVAYGWRPGSIKLALAGHAPVPAEDADARPGIVRENWDDENVQTLWGLRVSDAQRLAMIEVYLRNRTTEANGSAAEGSLRAAGQANLQARLTRLPPGS